MFNTMNVRHLFIDGDGSYNSGPTTESGRPCIVSGAFQYELDPDVHSVEELNERFKKVRAVSERAGYSVLRGMKERGMSLPTANLTSFDVEMRADEDNAEE